MTKKDQEQLCTPEQLAARQVLALAVKQAEENLIDLVRSGQAKWSNDAFTMLTGLAVHTGMVIEGGGVNISVEEMMKLQQFIATAEEYSPSAAFPFTKEQLRQAWSKL